MATSKTDALPVTRTLAEYAVSLRYSDLPDDVRQIAKQGILDWVGVAVAGANEPASKIVYEESVSHGGAGSASVFGFNTRLPTLQAALVNGTSGHALDYDDKHFAVPGHPSSPVLPAVFALGEALGKSGQDIIAAYVIGVEVGCRVGLFLGDSHYEKGWHASGTVGTFGAAAASASLLGLNAVQLTHAFGIAGTQSAGLKSMFGSMSKSLNIGKASANGLYASLLAARGFTAALDVLEGSQGSGETQSADPDPTAALADLPQRFLIRDLLFKYHASCYATHAAIESALILRETLKLTSSDISAVEIRVPTIALKMCNIQNPSTGLEAKFSLTQTCAMAFCGINTADIGAYNDLVCANSSVVRLRRISEVVGTSELEPGTAEVRITTNGMVRSQFVDMRIPESDLARQRTNLVRKFAALTGAFFSPEVSARISDRILSFDTAADISSVMELVAPRKLAA